MSIEISVVKTPEHAQLSKVCQIFTERGGTIGRSQESTWVLDDPERFISSTHTQILYENGQYYLSDVSTNGTFLNGSPEPIGNGNRVLLKDGDSFSLGDYEFQVNMQSNGTAELPSADDPFGSASFAAQANSHQSYADMNTAPALDFSDPFSSSSAGLPHFGHDLPISNNEETDPLAMLDKVGGNMHGNPFMDSALSVSQPDHTDPMQQSVAWPNLIPDDWDHEGTEPEEVMSTVAAAPVRLKSPPPHADVNKELLEKLQASEIKRAALDDENHKLLTEIMQLKQKIKNMQNSSSRATPVSHTAQVDENLLDAMGLGEWKLTDAKKAEISATAGLLVREAIAGLMQTLTFRKKIKEEFRINVTTIQPIENNPLKFSANMDDALENMFIKDNKAYMKPLDAVREGFQGMSEHQIAVLAGIQAAFRGMLERLDPEALEKRFEKYRKTGVIKVGQRGKNWESYKEFHQDLVNNIDNSFQYLFGYDFVQAYEEQLQRLVMSRKSQSKRNI